uniref:Transmembrane protein n=1 Tax=Chromera velia CCMP2878 TaxID=1169474 RepID=A0A0G4G5L8_9ALVE|eukprot:Cvel_20390.t1-p1 / transcript=Cvel_20390.t1 / gene=Cvel_20390 / organism=Chromera_velia_CCMP2878 / gene_product=hypothetical protein / transcript_product=hypothetical protein / location=Cvel_scaffold1825:26380-29492(-) / protein_length=828 / sequence_SO=supercontig / SO=protein_coding / is_pseudo=false
MRRPSPSPSSQSEGTLADPSRLMFLKLQMPCRFHLYLHDTPSRVLIFYLPSVLLVLITHATYTPVKVLDAVNIILMPGFIFLLVATMLFPLRSRTGRVLMMLQLFVPTAHTSILKGLELAMGYRDTSHRIPVFHALLGPFSSLGFFPLCMFCCMLIVICYVPRAVPRRFDCAEALQYLKRVRGGAKADRRGRDGNLGCCNGSVDFSGLHLPVRVPAEDHKRAHSPAFPSVSSSAMQAVAKAEGENETRCNVEVEGNTEGGETTEGTLRRDSSLESIKRPSVHSAVSVSNCASPPVSPCAPNTHAHPEPHELDLESGGAPSVHGGGEGDSPSSFSVTDRWGVTHSFEVCEHRCSVSSFRPETLRSSWGGWSGKGSSEESEKEGTERERGDSLRRESEEGGEENDSSRGRRERKRETEKRGGRGRKIKSQRTIPERLASLGERITTAVSTVLCCRRPTADYADYRRIALLFSTLFIFISFYSDVCLGTFLFFGGSSVPMPQNCAFPIGLAILLLALGQVGLLIAFQLQHAKVEDAGWETAFGSSFACTRFFLTLTDLGVLGLALFAAVSLSSHHPEKSADANANLREVLEKFTGRLMAVSIVTNTIKVAYTGALWFSKWRKEKRRQRQRERGSGNSRNGGKEEGGQKTEAAESGPTVKTGWCTAPQEEEKEGDSPLEKFSVPSEEGQTSPPSLPVSGSGQGREKKAIDGKCQSILQGSVEERLREKERCGHTEAPRLFFDDDECPPLVVYPSPPATCAATSKGEGGAKGVCHRSVGGPSEEGELRGSGNLVGAVGVHERVGDESPSSFGFFDEEMGGAVNEERSFRCVDT